MERGTLFEATITYSLHATKAARGYEKDIIKGIVELQKSTEDDDKTKVKDLISSVYEGDDGSSLTDDINNFVVGSFDVTVAKEKNKKLIVRVKFSVNIKTTAEKIADELLSRAHLETAYGTFIPISAVVDVNKL